MSSVTRPDSVRPSTPALAVQALRMWGPRQIGFAAISSVVVALVIGIATVLIPNPIFGREIPPEWWNYPVWIVTSILTGMLFATFIAPRGASHEATALSEDASDSGETAESYTLPDGAAANVEVEKEARRTSRMGVAGGILAWFAVGCPVCNKLALLALGYSGAITWFAPIQPFLAFGALILTGVALVWRLRGQIYCPTPVKVAA